MSGSGVRLQVPDVLSSVQLKNLELKSLTKNNPLEYKVLDKQSQLMNSPCGDPNKELNHKEENQ